MEYHLTRDIQNKKGIISNLNGFLNRDLDTGYSSKWSGYWSPPYKYLDYHSIKINGLWLDQNTLKKTEYTDKLKFIHETDSLTIIEKISAPKNTSGFKINLKIKNKTKDKKASHVLIEPAIDIRKRDKDIQETTYETIEKENKLKINSSIEKSIEIKSSEKITVTGEPHYKNHYPGEKQKCFIPGHISIKKEIKPQKEEEIQLSFKTSKKESESKVEKSDSKLKDLKNLDYLFNCSKDSMNNLVYEKENNLGLIAGHPWFQNFWARDTFWSTLGLIDIGQFELAHEILENYAEKDEFPIRTMIDGKDARKNGDSAPLYIIAANKLERHWKTSDKIKKKQKEAMKQLKLKENGVVDHDPEGTWMDTLERHEAVEMQALWLEAAQIMQDNRESKLKKGLEQFEKEEYMRDTLQKDSSQTINPAISLLFGQLEDEKAEKYLETLNGEFNSLYGARTRAMTDPGYSASGYHTGSVWGLTTCWAAAANLRYGNEQQGINFLEKLTQYLNRNQLGALPEVVDAEEGYSLGCSEQAWSAGLALNVIDSYLLGIKVKSPEKIVIDPAEKISCVRKNKRVGDERIDIEFDNGSAKIIGNHDLKIEKK